MLLIQKMTPRKRGIGVRRAGAGRGVSVCLIIALANAAGCTPPEPQAHAPSDGWVQFSDPARGIAFRYPREDRDFAALFAATPFTVDQLDAGFDLRLPKLAGFLYRGAALRG